VIPRLWYITDGARASGGRPLIEVIAAAARGGVEAVLVRERGLSVRELGVLCRELRPLREKGLRVFLSRRVDLALALSLDGVQLTADSTPVAEARSWLAHAPWAPEVRLGYSAHSLAEAEQLAAQGIDYLTLSPIFPTDSKPGVPALGLDELARASRSLSVPVLALGGLTPERAREALRAGAHGIAAASGIGAAEDVEAAAAAFHRSLTEHIA
jgi:thiamine-phosphate diphosphorylase